MYDVYLRQRRSVWGRARVVLPGGTAHGVVVEYRGRVWDLLLSLCLRGRAVDAWAQRR
jgi:hypothetical protein